MTACERLQGLRQREQCVGRLEQPANWERAAGANKERPRRYLSDLRGSEETTSCYSLGAQHPEGFSLLCVLLSSVGSEGSRREECGAQRSLGELGWSRCSNSDGRAKSAANRLQRRTSGWRSLCSPPFLGILRDWWLIRPLSAVFSLCNARPEALPNRWCHFSRLAA